MLHKKQKSFFIPVLFALAAIACGSFSVGIEPTQTLDSGTGSSEDQNSSNRNDILDESQARDDSSSNNSNAVYWKEVQDNTGNIHMVVPCYWRAEFYPWEQGNPVEFTGYLYNFTEDYARSFGKASGTIWDYGAMKVDLGTIAASDFGLPPASTPVEMAQAMYGQDEENKLLSADVVTINGQSAAFVVTESLFGVGEFYLITYTDEYFIIANPIGSDQQHEDLMGIINSISTSSNTAVVYPTHKPSVPPEELSAPCLENADNSNGGMVSAETFGTLGCPGTTGTPEAFFCEIVLDIKAINMEDLMNNMADPFTIGYWRSEGIQTTPQEALQEIYQYRLPTNRNELTFTIDRNEFPTLQGMQPEQLIDPSLNVSLVVYSKGWGTDGLGEALIYIVQNQNGQYYWNSLVFSAQPFDN